jgi:hypothetical protein
MSHLAIRKMVRVARAGQNVPSRRFITIIALNGADGNRARVGFAGKV